MTSVSTTHRASPPWQSMEHVKFETLTQVDWFSNQRLLEPISDVLPPELEALRRERREAPVTVAGPMN